MITDPTSEIKAQKCTAKFQLVQAASINGMGESNVNPKFKEKKGDPKRTLQATRYVRRRSFNENAY